MPGNKRPFCPSALAVLASVIAVALLLAGCGGSAVEETESSTGPLTDATTPLEPGSPADSSSPASSDTPENAASPAASEREPVVSAAQAAARKNNPAIGGLEVLNVKIDGGWARVDMRPDDGSADAAHWLLQKRQGVWTVVDFGTTIVPADHPDAPASIFE